jgi:K+ transporter
MLFWVQKKGTGKVSTFFGPITRLWFIVMGSMQVWLDR